MILIKVNGDVLQVQPEANSSAQSFIEYLKQGEVSLEMKEYARMEKFGQLARSFPENDAYMTTSPGDVILYQGNQLVIYYASNTWNFTRLGKVINKDEAQLRKILGKKDVAVTLGLSEE